MQKLRVHCWTSLMYVGGKEGVVFSVVENHISLVYLRKSRTHCNGERAFWRTLQSAYASKLCLCHLHYRWRFTWWTGLSLFSPIYNGQFIYLCLKLNMNQCWCNSLSDRWLTFFCLKYLQAVDYGVHKLWENNNVGVC